MEIIKAGDSGIINLWGSQDIRLTDYRLMKYLIREKVDNKEFICNNVTGELVLLNKVEQKLLEEKTIVYTSCLDELISHYFLVPINYNECEAVVGMRKVLRILEPKHDSIIHYVIFPTTSCNARCYYCFEKGSKIETMTKQIAEEVITFIANNCGNNKVILDWFGGEPTVAINRIDQICEGLSSIGINYTSAMTTNGYLLTSDVIKKAVKLWHLNNVMISVDGVGDTYNRIKSYITLSGNPYDRVMDNIGYLLEADIKVGLRMNFDINNYDEFGQLLEDILRRYPNFDNLSVWAHSVIYTF